MATTQQLKNKKRKQAIFRLLILALILICMNVLTSYFHAGIDLTKEKRYTMTEPTKRMLRGMKETAVIEVFLKGKLPADLQRLQEAVREELSAFRDISGNKIVFKFTNPLEGKSDAEQKEIVHNLQQKGVDYFQLETKDEDNYSLKVFFPFALVSYNGREMPIALLESPPGRDRVKQTTYATALLEYKLANALNQMSKPYKPKVAYLFGNNEDKSIHTADMLYALSQYYSLDSVDLKHTLHISNAFDALIINQPTMPFMDPEKLKIDQYIMRGGHVLWIVNPMNASMDSFKQGVMKFMSFEYGLNLDDILFKYGVRVNNDLVEDLQNIQIPLMNGSPQMRNYDWVYYPKINPTSQHPIVRNMDFIQGTFTSSIDTIFTPTINKTVLLTTSKYSRVAGSPVTVSLTKINYPGREEYFNKPYRPVAVLLEGKFHSLYEHRLAPDYLARLDSLNEPFVPFCKENTSMIVTSIGDVFKNDYSTKDGVLPLGYNKYMGEFFANKSFLLNSLEYLTDRSGVLEARSKDIKLRLLDTGRVKEELSIWQWVNMLVPIVIILMFASAFMFFRKRRYENSWKKVA